MTDKELHKLRRAELLEILFYLQNELDTIKQENERLKQQAETAAENQKNVEEILRLVQQTAERVETLCPQQETEQ